jgi:hypothetical protein
MRKSYYFSEDICARCEGKCCKTIPGCCSPTDIKRLFPAKSLLQSVKKALESGNFSVDWYEDSPPKPYVRPATKDCKGKKYDPSWGGECIFLTESGCSLDGKQRPDQCKRVMPQKDFDCDIPDEKHKGKLAYAEIWAKENVDLWKWYK